MVISKQQRVNEMIRAREVRVISPDGEQLGIMPANDALQLAETKGLDLVEVAPDAKPPVCRIMDFGKYKYQQSKRLQQAKKKQKVISIKEIKLRPKTEEHDYQYKTKHIRRFLQDGHKAKVTIMFRGREMAHVDLGRRILDRVAVDLEDVGTVEQTPKQEGRNMTMVLSPRLAAAE
jgi:translation initiation factor IF-3